MELDASQLKQPMLPEVGVELSVSPSLGLLRNMFGHDGMDWMLQAHSCCAITYRKELNESFRRLSEWLVWHRDRKANACFADRIQVVAVAIVRPHLSVIRRPLNDCAKVLKLLMNEGRSIECGRENESCDLEGGLNNLA